MSNHFRLDLNLVELLSRVDANHATNHFGDHNHVSKVCLDKIRLLVGFSLLLGLTQLLDQPHGLALETAVEPTASAGVNDIAKLVGR